MIFHQRIGIYLLVLAALSLRCNSDISRKSEIIDGKRIEYYPDGQIKSKESLSNNRKNGEAIYYSENGTIEERGEYLNDQVSGCWVSYYPDGSIKSFNEYFRNDSLDKSGASRYPNRFLTFDQKGNVDLDVMTMYYDMWPVDTLNGKYWVLSLEYLIADRKCRIVYSHGDSFNFDTLGAEENPVAFYMRSPQDYVYGMIECYSDTIWTDGEWGYSVTTSYFDSRKPPCNLEDFKRNL